MIMFSILQSVANHGGYYLYYEDFLLKLACGKGKAAYKADADAEQEG